MARKRGYATRRRHAAARRAKRRDPTRTAGLRLAPGRALEQAYAQARFEFLRIAVEPRFEGPLRTEMAPRLDLHRAVIGWRVPAVVPPAAAVAPQAAAGFAQGPQAAGTPPARKPLP